MNEISIKWIKWLSANTSAARWLRPLVNEQTLNLFDNAAMLISRTVRWLLTD